MLSFRERLTQLKQHPRPSLRTVARKATDFGVDVVIHAAKSAYTTLTNLYKNAESVAILTLAGIGVTSFIGELTIEHVLLSSLIATQMVPAVAGVASVWGLLQIASLRQQRHLRRAAA